MSPQGVPDKISGAAQRQNQYKIATANRPTTCSHAATYQSPKDCISKIYQLSKQHHWSIAAVVSSKRVTMKHSSQHKVAVSLSQRVTQHKSNKPTEHTRLQNRYGFGHMDSNFHHCSNSAQTLTTQHASSHAVHRHIVSIYNGTESQNLK